MTVDLYLRSDELSLLYLITSQLFLCLVSLSIHTHPHDQYTHPLLGGAFGVITLDSHLVALVIQRNIM